MEYLEAIAEKSIERICRSVHNTDDFWQHCYITLAELEIGRQAHNEGWLERLVWKVARSERHWYNSAWTKSCDNDITLDFDIPEGEKDEQNNNSQRLERYLYEAESEDEYFIKRIVMIYLREGSVHQAYVASRIHPETINKCIAYVINNFHSDRSSTHGVSLLQSQAV